VGGTDKAKHKAQEMTGKAKDKVGEMTGDDDMQAEGKTDEAKGNLKQAGDKVKDAFK
jgi:uncharacterized protein YjbJ (UPF0337 family)